MLLYSNRRSDGVILDALIGDQPKSDLIPKLVPGCWADGPAGAGATRRRTSSSWSRSTATSTLTRRRRRTSWRAWLGDQYAGESTFRGRTTDYKQIDVPMAYLAQNAQDQQNLIMRRTGRPAVLPAGHALRAEGPESARVRCGVHRRADVEAVDNPGDVTPKRQRRMDHQGRRRGAREADDGGAGAALSRALSDPLPAGLEALNPALATTGTLPRKPISRRDRATTGGGGPGTSTRTCATSGPRRSPRRCGRACTTTATSPRHDAGAVRRAAGEGRRDVCAGDVRAQRRRCGDRAVGTKCLGARTTKTRASGR